MLHDRVEHCDYSILPLVLRDLRNMDYIHGAVLTLTPFLEALHLVPEYPCGCVRGFLPHCNRVSGEMHGGIYRKEEVELRPLCDVDYILWYLHIDY